ncbi:hypothetical protein P7C70_g2554, partial [Phenoliferia sp. Uapishka_3]
MSTLISLATPSDFPSIASLQLSAFSPSLFHQAVFGSVADGDMIDWFLSRLVSSWNSPKGPPKVLKVVLGGEIVACAVWRLVGFDEAAEGEGAKESGVSRKGSVDELEFPIGANVDLMEQIKGEQGAGLEKEEKHWYCSLLVTDPRFQKTGAGSALLKWGCDKADEWGVPAYLKGTPKGMSLYERFGFVAWHTRPITVGQNPELVVRNLSFLRLGLKGEIFLMLSLRHRQLQPMMRLPQLIVLPALTSDISDIVALHYAATAKDPLYLNLYEKASKVELAAKMKERTGKVVGSRDRQLLKAMKGGKIVGFAQFVYPKRKEGNSGRDGKGETRGEKSKPDWVDGVNVELAEDFFDRMGARYESIIEPHYYLQMLSVDPSAQRSGTGAAMVSSILKLAEQDKVPVLLDSSLGKLVTSLPNPIRILFNDAL